MVKRLRVFFLIFILALVLATISKLLRDLTGFGYARSWMEVVIIAVLVIVIFGIKYFKNEHQK